MLRSSRRDEFERAVRTYSTDLYRFAYWLCRDRHRAQDLVQEALLRAWNAWDGMRDPNALKSWLFTIVRNEHARSFERKRLEVADTDVSDLEIGVAPRFHEALEMREALRALPESLREPLLLQVLGGFSCGEIAAMLATTEGAVMTRLTRARQTLRKLVDGTINLKEQSA